MNRVAIPTLILAVLTAAPVAAQEMMQPGPAQRRLDFLVGTWDLASRAYMGDKVHTATQRAEIAWLPGGVWLDKHHDELDTPIGKMFGAARIAWDSHSEEYVHYWIDNQSAVVLPQRGRFVDDNTLEFRGSFTWVDGSTFHQRMVIVNDPAGGWRQTGYMGRDPESLRLNHESVATPARSATMPLPDWLRGHMEFITRDGGRWETDNAAYRSDTEPFDAYGMEWRWGPGRQSIAGRLFGLKDGVEQGTFWEFRTAWHPGEGRALAVQYGAGGAVGEGTLEPDGPGKARLLQVFHGPDGSISEVGHESEDSPEGTHVTRSFDVQPDGRWKPRRTYVWKRMDPDGSAGGR